MYLKCLYLCTQQIHFECNQLILRGKQNKFVKAFTMIFFIQYHRKCKLELQGRVVEWQKEVTLHSGNRVPGRILTRCLDLQVLFAKYPMILREKKKTLKCACYGVISPFIVSHVC